MEEKTIKVMKKCLNEVSGVIDVMETKLQAKQRGLMLLNQKTSVLKKEIASDTRRYRKVREEEGEQEETAPHRCSHFEEKNNDTEDVGEDKAMGSSHEIEKQRKSIGSNVNVNCTIEFIDEKSDSNDVRFQNGYRCQYPGCGKSFKLPASLTNHQNTHTDKYQCKTCQTCCQSNAHLKNHLRTHSEERPFVCNWVGCGKKYKKKDCLKKHIKKMHPKNEYQVDVNKDLMTVDGDQMTRSNDAGISIENQNPGDKKRLNGKVSLEMSFFECNNCQELFKRKIHLELPKIYKRDPIEHQNIAGPSQTGYRFRCQQPGCAKSHKNEGDLKKHLQNIHETDFLCQVCQMCFESRQTLEHHLPVLSNKNPFPCDWPGCIDKFEYEIVLKVHRLVNHEFPFQCIKDGCGRSFKTKQALQEHLESVHSSL